MSKHRLKYIYYIRYGIVVEMILFGITISMWKHHFLNYPNDTKVLGNNLVVDEINDSSAMKKDYIKWVDFTVSYDALCEAYAWDVDTHETDHEVDWIALLAYTAARTGGTFDKKAMNILGKTAEKLAEGETTMEELTKDMKYYAYYLEAYRAVLGGLVDEYEAEIEDENGHKSFQTKYGLKAYFLKATE